MPHGPVPSFSKNVIDDVLEGDDDVEESLLEYVSVNRRPKHPQFVSKTKPNLGELSKSEIEVLDATIAQYGRLEAWSLRELSHKEPCWLIAHGNKPDGVESVEMPYELFFEGQSDEVKALLELVRAEQENRDFASDLAR
jgi:hypothetical protein